MCIRFGERLLEVCKGGPQGSSGGWGAGGAGGELLRAQQYLRSSCFSKHAVVDSAAAGST